MKAMLVSFAMLPLAAWAATPAFATVNPSSNASVAPVLQDSATSREMEKYARLANRIVRKNPQTDEVTYSFGKKYKKALALVGKMSADQRRRLAPLPPHPNDVNKPKPITFYQQRGQ